jgi:hypothetical protein
MKYLGMLVTVSLVVLTLRVEHLLATGEAHHPQVSTSPFALGGNPPDSETNHRQVTYRLDFSDYPGGSLEAWLESKGFKFREAAKDPQALKLSVQDGALILEANERLRGFLFKDSMDIKNFSKVRLEWGILKYPEGASYEKQIRNEALMVYISFGHEKIPSGLLVLPNVPYFIGLFLCQDDKLDTPYLGRYYQEGGRFVCLAHAEPEQTVVSEFDLTTAFRAYFDKDEVPPITAINLGVDTSDAGNGGKAAAYVKSIEFIP